MTHDIFQPGLFVFIVHTSPVYLDQRWQNQQQHYADRDLQNSYSRHDCAQTCSSCFFPHPLSFRHCTSFLPYPACAAQSARKQPQPPVALLKSGKMKSKLPQENQQQEMGGKRHTGIRSSSCPARGVAAGPASCASLWTQQPPPDFQPCTNTSLSRFMGRCGHLSVFPTNGLSQ